METEYVQLTIAMLDTGPFYLGVRWLSAYLEIDSNAEAAADRDQVELGAVE